MGRVDESTARAIVGTAVTNVVLDFRRAGRRFDRDAAGSAGPADENVGQPDTGHGRIVHRRQLTVSAAGAGIVDQKRTKTVPRVSIYSHVVQPDAMVSAGNLTEVGFTSTIIISTTTKKLREKYNTADRSTVQLEKLQTRCIFIQM